MRQVLLITYHFPPAGGVSVQRMLKFARYLPCHDYAPTVLTVDPKFAAYGASDEALLEQIPEEATIVRTRSWDPLSVYARLRGLKKADVSGVSLAKDSGKSWMGGVDRWLRGNVFLPDARAGWVPFAIGAARRLMRRQQFAAIMTSGPPHSTHFVGRYLKARTGIPWIADFRDPWTDYFYNKHFRQSRLAKIVDARMERSILSRADVVVSVSDSVGAGLRSKARLRGYETIANGYDPYDFPSVRNPVWRHDSFVIAHVGTYSKDKHSKELVRVIRSLEADIKVRLVGSTHVSVVEDWEKAKLGQSLETIPHVPHLEALTHMAEADLLLLLIEKGQCNKGIVTGKLFEYLATGRPVMAIGPPDGDMARILRETRNGEVFDYDDVRGMRAFLNKHLQRLKEGKPWAPPDKQALAAYDRRALTRKLSYIIDDLARF